MFRPAVLKAGLLAACALLACGEQEPRKDEPPRPARADLVQALFETRDEGKFESLVKTARKAGISDQILLEARFLLLVDLGRHEDLAALAPALVAQSKSFRIEDSAIFSVPEEFLAITQYSLALDALHKDDHAGFKTHITEAFWLSPRQADAFRPHIERHRLAQAMQNVRIDFQRSFKRQEDDQSVSLASLAAQDAPAVLFHFWSPWSTECEAELPDFLATRKELARHRIPTISVLEHPDPEILKDARAFRSRIEKQADQGAWILDSRESPLARLLRIQDLPTVVLARRDGAILFNGHPSESRLWQQLRRLAPDLSRPSLPRPPEARDAE